MEINDPAPGSAKPGKRLEQAVRDLTDSVQRHLSVYTPEVGQLLQKLASESGRPPAEVFLAALGLYKIALDADKEGHRLAIVDDSWDVIRGVNAPWPAPQHGDSEAEPGPVIVAGRAN